MTRFKRLARHEFEHEEEAALLLADFVERRDVRVRQHRGDARVALQRLTPIARSAWSSAPGTLTATVRPRWVSRAR